MTAHAGHKKPGADELRARAAAVSVLIFDVDGVLTDGGLYYGPEGEALKRFDVKDGHALVLARLAGVRTAILTARTSNIVEVRGKELGLAAVHQGKRDKGTGLTDLLGELGVEARACAYMGDDLNDLEPMARVGLAACPSDAASEVRQQAQFVSSRPGGHGAARELVELVLKSQNRWTDSSKMVKTGNG